MNTLLNILSLGILWSDINIAECRIHPLRRTQFTTQLYVSYHTKTNFSSIDFNNYTKINKLGKKCNLKLSSWNIMSIEGIINKDFLEYIRLENPDILYVQRLKCLEEKMPEKALNIPGYYFYSFTNDTKSIGVGIYTKIQPLAIFKGVNHAKRYRYANVITAEFEEFFAISAAALPPGGKMLNLIRRMFWDSEFQNLISRLDKVKPVIIGGSLKVAGSDLDVFRPDIYKKKVKFPYDERAVFKKLLASGFNDTFHVLYPKVTARYTFFSSNKNKYKQHRGRRTDYFLVSQRLTPGLCDSIVRNTVYGSRHYPLFLSIRI